MVNLDKLGKEFADRGVTVTVIGYGDQPIASNPDSYKAFRKAFKDAANVQLLFDPAFDPPRSFKLNSERTAWILDKAGKLLFENRTTQRDPYYELNKFLEKCINAEELPEVNLATLPPVLQEGNLLTQDEVDKVVGKLRVEEDEFSGRLWFFDRQSPQHENRNGFFLYIGMEERSFPWLRLRVQYESDHWLFIQSFDVKTDDEYYSFTVDQGEIKRDNWGGSVWEWCDDTPDEYTLEMIGSVISSTDAQIRFYGTQYQDTRDITRAEKKALRNILDSYEILQLAVEQGLAVKK